MKKLFIILAATALAACSSTSEAEKSGLAEHLMPEIGALNYTGSIPSENSKVPTCKNGDPDKVTFVLTDEFGITRSESVPASTDANGFVTTLTGAPFPVGESTVEGIHLMRANDTLYSIPHENDLQIERYADVTVPFQVEVTEDTQLSGTAFCYTQQTIDIPDDELIAGGFGNQRLQTLWIDVQGDCIDIVTVTIDNYRILEIYPFEDGIYEVPIPESYSRMDIRAYTPEFQSGANDFQSYFFGAETVQGTNLPVYNADGILDVSDIVSFQYDCPPEEIFDESL